MGSEWPAVTIESLIQSGAITAHKDGNYGSQYPRVEEFGAVGIPFLTAKSLNNGNVDINGAPRLSEERANELRFGFIKPGDVLLSHNATIGRVAVVPDFEGRLLVGTSLTYFRVNPAKISARYLAAYFSGADFQNQLSAVMSLSTRNQVPITLQRRLRVVLPPLHEQQEVAHVLGAFHDKIELNRRMNETLEATARAIFKSWFVDFDPVRAKAEDRQPAGMSADIAALFPSKLKERIPVGWKPGALGAVAENKRAQVKPREAVAETSYIGLEHMPRKSIAIAEWGRAGEVASNKFAFSTGDILFGKLRPYFHKVGVAAIDGVCSTDILVLNAKSPEWFGYVLGHVSSDELIAYTDAASTGTKMPRTSWSDLARYEVVIPTPEVARAFSEIVSPMIQKIRNNIHESRTLASLRDMLLPKLLSGEVRVTKTSDAVLAQAEGR